MCIYIYTYMSIIYIYIYNISPFGKDNSKNLVQHWCMKQIALQHFEQDPSDLRMVPSDQLKSMGWRIEKISYKPYSKPIENPSNQAIVKLYIYIYTSHIIQHSWMSKKYKHYYSKAVNTIALSWHVEHPPTWRCRIGSVLEQRLGYIKLNQGMQVVLMGNIWWWWLSWWWWQKL